MAQSIATRMPDALGCDGVNLLNSMRQRRLADRLSLPHARDPALRRRSAEAAVDAGRSRSSMALPQSPQLLR